MRNALTWLGMGAFALASCAPSASPETVLKLQPKASGLVDNLFIGDQPAATSAPLGGTVGKFYIEGGCLIVKTTGEPQTPVFWNGPVEVTAQAVRVHGRDIAYGSEVRLPMIGGGVRVRSPNSRCPTEALIIRSVD